MNFTFIFCEFWGLLRCNLRSEKWHVERVQWQTCLHSGWAWVVTAIWLSRPSSGHSDFHKKNPLLFHIVSQFASYTEWRQHANLAPRLFFFHILKAKVGFRLGGRETEEKWCRKWHCCLRPLLPQAPSTLPADRLPIACQPQSGKRGWRGCYGLKNPQ